MIVYSLIIFCSLCCAQPDGNNKEPEWTKPDLNGHWKLHDTQIVDHVPFLNLQAPEPDPQNRVSEDSPWDSYTGYDLVFEADSMYRVNYPIQAFPPLRYSLDTGYVHLSTGDYKEAYPAELVNDTLVFYRPLKSEPGYFKEQYLRTNFNDSVLNIMKYYGINYPELAGTWHLVREKDYDYGTHYELNFPHTISDSIHFSREQMQSALQGELIYWMPTDGRKRDYSFVYRNPYIYFTPRKWYRGEDPCLHFYRD